MNSFLLGILFFPTVWCYQHYVLYLTFHPTGEMPALQMRLRHEDASFSIQMNREIRIYLDQRPIEWKALIEGAQGERNNFTIYPQRKKNEIRVTAVDNELAIVYHLGCEPNFYGPNCAKRCVPDENDGRYTCDVSGLRKCRNGWIGDRCDERQVTTTTTSTRPPRTTQRFASEIIQSTSKAIQTLTSNTLSSTIPPTTTSSPRPSTATSIPRPIGEVIIESPNKISRLREMDPVLVSAIIITVALFVLVVAVILYFLLCYKRQSFHKHQLLLPAPSKCEVAAVPKHSPPRYVPSPRRSAAISFCLTPKLPDTAAPSHYMSQEDLHV